MAVELNLREQILARILRMREEEVAQVAAFMAELQDDDALDHAIIQAHKGEPGIDLDDLISELGFTPEEIENVARTERLIE